MKTGNTRERVLAARDRYASALDDLESEHDELVSAIGSFVESVETMVSKRDACGQYAEAGAEWSLPLSEREAALLQFVLLELYECIDGSDANARDRRSIFRRKPRSWALLQKALGVTWTDRA